MSRFMDIDDGVVEVFLNTLEERFPSLIQLKIKLIFDTKKRVVKGKICLASVEIANDKIKYFSKDNVATEGYDVVIIFDRKAWELADEPDRKRIMSHELRHILINEKGEVKIIPHDVSDFRAEQKLNKDDPDWSLKLVTLVNDVYDQEKSMAKHQEKEISNGWKNENW